MMRIPIKKARAQICAALPSMLCTSAVLAALSTTAVFAATDAVPFPFRAEDLPPGSVWKVANNHYDLSVRRYDEQEHKWSKYRPGTNPDADRAQDEMAYGLPVHSSFAGKVIDCWRNAPNNPPHRPHEARDGCNDEDGDGNVCDQNPTCSCRIPPGGNHITVLTDDGEAVLYAHMAPGSVPKSLCPHNGELLEDEHHLDKSLGGWKGHNPETFVPESQRATIHVGQILGRAGDTGKSGEVHLHNSRIVYPTGPTPPIAYTRLWVQKYPGGSTNVAPDDWVKHSGTLVFDPASALMPYFTRGLDEVSYHGIPAADYQFLFENAAVSGYRLRWIDGFSARGRTYFNVIFAPKDGIRRRYYHGLTAGGYQTQYDRAKADGFRLVHVDSYERGRGTRYAAIFAKDDGPEVRAYHGKSPAFHADRFKALKQQGFRPKVVSVVSHDGHRQITALYEKVKVGGFVHRAFMTPSKYQAEYDANKAAGRKLAYLNAYNYKGGTRFTAIWTGAAPAVKKAKHGMRSADYQTQFDDAMSKGLRTGAVTGYVNGSGRVRYAAYWTDGSTRAAPHRHGP
jgi:hypothetical protein